jgi:hypothetical protein
MLVRMPWLLGEHEFCIHIFLKGEGDQMEICTALIIVNLLVIINYFDWEDWNRL